MKYLLLPLLLVLTSCGKNRFEVVYTSAMNGKDGYNSVINVINSAPSCAAGGITVLAGIDVDNDGMVTSADENVQSSTVCNGVNGQDGATAPYAPVGTIAPCGNTVQWKEQLLCLGNGKLLGSFSENINGYNTRLSFLNDGSYVNSDGSNCSFTVSTLIDGSSKVTWSSGFQVCQKH
jgi:hypothetical protein